MYRRALLRAQGGEWQTLSYTGTMTIKASPLFKLVWQFAYVLACAILLYLLPEDWRPGIFRYQIWVIYMFEKEWLTKAGTSVELRICLY
jgi:hypothetical protein